MPSRPAPQAAAITCSSIANSTGWENWLGKAQDGAEIHNTKVDSTLHSPDRNSRYWTTLAVLRLTATRLARSGGDFRP